MRLIKPLLASLLFILCLPLAAQTPVYEELEFEPDSIKSAYKPSGKNYVFVRSKRGNNGVNKTQAADAILSAEVSEIVLVYSELDASAIGEREEANRERWENLLKTYPELFQFSTSYKNLCQCNMNGDSAAFKKSQGFYVYVNGDVPKVEEPKTVVDPPPAKPKVEEKKAPEPPVAKTEKAAPTKTPEKEVAPAATTSVKLKEPPPVVEPPAVKETPASKPVVKETPKEVEEPVKETPAEETPVVKTTPKKAAVSATKPRRAKDPKSCRPPCYEGGDEDLYAFFKDNITYTKKQKRQAKKATVVVKLQLNFDGSVKKSMITGENEEVNQLVQGAINGMNAWKPAVKSGVTVKSEVKITLKWDSENKSLRPSEVMITPRPAPKCKCMSDSEMFGD